MNEALAKQRETKQSLDKIFLELNFVDKKELEALKKEEPVPTHKEKALLKRVDPEVLKLIPETIARRYHFIPLSKDGKVISVAMADPGDIVTIDTIRTISGYEINAIPGSEKDVVAAVEKNYSGSSDMETVLLDLVKVDASIELGAGVDATQVELRANDPPVVKFVNLLLLDAIERRAWEGTYEDYPLGVTFDYPSTLAAGMGIIFGSAEQEFRGIIDLLLSEGKAHLLSSPNIVTLEGQEAEIDVVDEYPYETYVVEEGVKETIIKFKSIGATLLVTPHIKEEKWVVLDIEPEVSEITGAPPFVGAPPIVGTRKARTQIAVNDGNTIVIGGLLRETEKETKSGVPFLSRIPILGSLFSHKTVKKEKTDLLILITPYVLPEEMEEVNVLEQRKPLKVQIEELYQKGLEKLSPPSNEIARKKKKGLVAVLAVLFLVAALSSN